MATKSTPKYKGELARPLPEPTFGETFTGQPSEQFAKRIATNLLLLFEHYGIAQGDPNPWFALALRLAQDHVPGFQRRDPFRKRPGRRAKWAGMLGMELHAGVIEYVRQGKSEANACRILAKQDKYRGAAPRGLLRRFKDVQQRHRNDGWSDDDILEYVRLVRTPGVIAKLVAEPVRAWAETLRKNSA